MFQKSQLTHRTKVLDVAENLIVAATTKCHGTLPLDIGNPVARSSLFRNGQFVGIWCHRDGANQGRGNTEEQYQMGQEDHHGRLKVCHLQDSSRWTCSEKEQRSLKSGIVQ